MADNVTAAGEAAAKATPGMPQLNPEYFGNQIFWLLLTLITIYLILSRVALPRIAGILAERQGTITNDIAAAEDLKAKAQEAEASYEKALADARSEAQRIAQETRDEIQAELNKAIEKADAEIAAKTAESEKSISEIRDGAKEAVQSVATEAAAEIVVSLGSKADAKAVSAAVAQRMKG